jgi:macrolide transport system ATP-binding/permease protein
LLLLEANHIKKYYQDRLILDLEELKVYDRDRIGIVGVNGAGKSTLMSILSGQLETDEGHVQCNVKVSSIHQFGSAEHNVEINASNSRWKLDLENFGHLSGGEKTRLQIANAFGNNSKLLFADEPTSHLDLAGIEMLEGEFKQFNGAVLLISHDRTLLDKVCTKIIEVEAGQIKEYLGNFSDYRKQKSHQVERANFEYDQYVKEKKRLEEAAQEQSQAASSMRKAPKRMGLSEARLHKNKTASKRARVDKAAKAIESRVEQLEVKEKPRELATVQFDVEYFSPIHGKSAVQLERVSKQFDTKLLFKDFSCIVKPGSKTALIGPNGAGKSTLMKMILNQETGVRTSLSAKVGYFDQTLSGLDEDKTILENVIEDSPYPEVMIRTVLARLLFKSEDVFKRVSVLSGGEKVKVALAKVFLGNFNILLLDEPTNFLDIFTHEELENVLKAYPGTILFATHDRSLMNSLADYVLVFNNGKIEFFDGNYEQYQKNKEKPSDTTTQHLGQELLKIENELTEVIGRLSMPAKGDSIEQLEERYQFLLREKRRLNS